MARGRIFEVTLPDGQVVTRTSESKLYTHAIIGGREGEVGVLGFSESYANATKGLSKFKWAANRQVVECRQVEQASSGSKAQGGNADYARRTRAAKAGAVAEPTPVHPFEPGDDDDQCQRCGADPIHPEPIVAPKPEGGNPTMARKITDRNLAVGTKLVAGYKGKTYHAEVVEVDGSGHGHMEVRYAVLEHDLAAPYKSLSAAGSAIFGIDKAGKPRTCNGWDFWKLDGEAEAVDTGATKPARARRAKATSTEPPTPDDAVYGEDGIGCAYCAHVSPDATKAAQHMEEAHPSGEPLPVVAYEQEAVAV